MLYQPTRKELAAALRKTLVYYDKGIIVVNKPAGMVCQLSHRVQVKQPRLSFNVLLEGIREELAMSELPYPIHRLDKDTSGALIIARTKDWAQKLHQQFIEGSVNKTYLALVHGGRSLFPRPRGVINAPLSDDDGRVFLSRDGKEAITEWEVLCSSPKVPLTLLRLNLLTGHKHQLRVHLAKCLNAPILGDDVYGKRSVKSITESVTIPKKMMFLHASQLSLTRFNKTGPHKRFTQTFRVPPPSKFKVICRDAKIPLDPSITKGEMLLDKTPWWSSDHPFRETMNYWLSDDMQHQNNFITQDNSTECE